MKLLPRAKANLLQNIAGRELKVALYTDKTVRTFYTTKGEVTGPGYEAGGKAAPAMEVHGDDIFVDDALVWDNASFEASSALIYDAHTGEGVFFEAFAKPEKSYRDAFSLVFPEILFTLT